MTEESRIEFEKWARYGGMEVHKGDAAPDYKVLHTQIAWEAWQAASKPDNALLGELAAQKDIEQWLFDNGVKYLHNPLTGSEKALIRDVLTAIKALAKIPGEGI